MSFRTLLVPVFGTDSDRDALDAAFALAREFDSHVEAVFARTDPRDSVPVLGEAVSGGMVEEIMKAAEHDVADRRRTARGHFDGAAARWAVRFADTPTDEEQATARWNEVGGRVEDVPVSEGRLADLIVFGAPPADDGNDQVAAIENALLGAGRPVLYVSDPPPAEIGRTVAIAWNGKAESARSVALAMPILETAETVHVLTAETALTQAAAGRRLVESLRWHRINASLSLLTPGTLPVGQVLRDKARQLGCDMLVMGGYGHSRMREMILGGVTRYMLGHSGIPVLMAH